MRLILLDTPASGASSPQHYDDSENAAKNLSRPTQRLNGGPGTRNYVDKGFGNVPIGWNKLENGSKRSHCGILLQKRSQT